MKLTRHVGIDKNSNARITLLMPLLEGSEYCLIAYTDSLPTDLREALLHIVNSDEGQREVELSKALSTRLYSDTGTSVLETLHRAGYIKKVSIDDVMMTPSPAYKVVLREVLVASGLMKRSIDNVEVEKFNPHKHNADAALHGEAVGTARNLLIEADLLDKAAADKREQAYRLAPQLRPVPAQAASVAEPATEASETPSMTTIEDKEGIMGKVVEQAENN